MQGVLPERPPAVAFCGAASPDTCSALEVSPVEDVGLPSASREPLSHASPRSRAPNGTA
jgi:hypothetical protein